MVAGQGGGEVLELDYHRAAIAPALDHLRITATGEKASTVLGKGFGIFRHVRLVPFRDLSRRPKRPNSPLACYGPLGRRLQQVRDAQGASQAELANAHSEQERLTQEREHLEQAIASLAANRDRLAAERARFGQRRSELQAQTDQQRS